MWTCPGLILMRLAHPRHVVAQQTRLDANNTVAAVHFVPSVGGPPVSAPAELVVEARQREARSQPRLSRRLQHTAMTYLVAAFAGRAFISASLALRYSSKRRSIRTDMTNTLLPGVVRLPLECCKRMSGRGRIGFVALALCVVQEYRSRDRELLTPNPARFPAQESGKQPSAMD